LLQGWQFPEKQQPIADRIQFRDIALFHGDLDMEKLNFIERSMIKNVKAPAGDFRDWEIITSWPEGNAAVLLEELPAVEAV